MFIIVMNSHALMAAAASIGIVGSEALAAYLGMELRPPVTPYMVATVLTSLPITLDAAFSIEEIPDAVEEAPVVPRGTWEGVKRRLTIYATDLRLPPIGQLPIA